jgi:hypothetical protein
MRLAATLLIFVCSLTATEHAGVQQYCTGCHSSRVKSGGLSIAELKSGSPEWEKVVRKLRTGMMPPAGAPRPDAAGIDALATSIEKELDEAATAKSNPGRPALHRLNRVEYANSVRDLLTLDIDPAAYLPTDDSSHGFDNIAEVLNVSPTLMEGYVRAAGKISRLAVGDASVSPLVETYHLPSTLSQTQHIEGTPAGTRGGIVIHHNFPADGEYILKLTLYFTTNTFVFGTHQKGEQIEVALNGERVALLDVNPQMKVDDDLRTGKLKIKAGPQTITVAFIQRAFGPVEDFVQPFDHSLGDLFLGRTQGLTGLPHLRDVGINGPYNVTGVSDTPSRERIFTCKPKQGSEEIPCAKKILSALARQAYRHPASAEDVEDLLSTFQAGRNKSDFEGGIRIALQLILANPEFVFRFEQTPRGVTPGANYRVSDFELASRLSYFLWSRGPDEPLLALAARGRLKDPAVLQQQVTRMLADPRSEALAKNFAGQWLYLRNLEDAQPDLFAYPNFNRNLLDAMRRETELFFMSILHEDRNVLDLLNADYTFVNENLARHYGIPDVVGSNFRRVSIADQNRRGLLGQGSILTVTSYANRTSPVVRGKWVLDNLLGAPPPNPPANVPPLKENLEGAKPLAVRARLEEHRSNPACAGCHTMMDPIGFALENFDATGAWRVMDSGFPIDANGKLVDGTKVDGPVSLRLALVNHSGAFISTFTEKLLTYALGRGLEAYDMPTVRSIDREAARTGDRFSSIVLGIVKSAPFQLRRAEEETKSNVPN